MSPLYLTLIAYDIADPRRLRRVAKELEEAGLRLQKSVFECGLTPDALLALRQRLLRLIHPGEDSLLIQPICTRCHQDILWQGKPPPTSTEPYWIV